MNQFFFKVNVGKESYIWLFVVGALLAAIRCSSIHNGVYLSTVLALLVLGLIWYFVFYYANYKIADNKLLIKTLEGKKVLI